MTTPLAADQQFREALRVVRRHPLATERKPAFSLPYVSPRQVRATEGPVEGRSDDLWSTAVALHRGETDVEEIVRRSSERIAGFSQTYNAFEHVADVSQVARELAEEASRGAWRGPLHGLPLSIKDIIDVADMPTTGSSVAVAPRHPDRDATAVARLRGAGGIIVGKTVTHEFALGVTTPQSYNPWDVTRLPGGSSGGSAISVLTGMALGSLGTDTRASIRVPSALTGLVGFRPTTGLVPVDNWMTLSWSLDVFAPMSRSVRDSALMMDVLTDSGGSFRAALPGSMARVRVGYADAFVEGAEDGVRRCFEEALEAIERAGGAVSRMALPGERELELANVAGMVLSRAEAAQVHLEAGTDLSRCTPEVRDQLSEAQGLLATDYVRCLRIRDELYEHFFALFEDVDVMAMPTSKVVAPVREDAERYLLVLSENCITWSLIGFPAISIFAGLSEGLPAGIQLVARPHQDAFLLACAQALERELPEAPVWQP